MATEIIRTIKSLGGDYPSLSAWEAGQQGNLVTLDEIHIAECYSMQDTANVTIAGWTTDATRYIKIYTPASERHNGTSGNGYRLESTGNPATAMLAVNNANIKIDGIGIKLNLDRASTYNVCEIITAEAGFVNLSNCLIYDSTNIGAGGMIGLYVSFSGTNALTVNIWNNIIYGNETNGISFITNNANAIVNAYSNTVCNNSSWGFNRVYNTVGTVNLKNNYAGGSGGGYDSANTWDIKTTCASSDTTGSTGLQNKAIDTTNFVNVTAGSYNFHLPLGSALIDVGTNTSGESAPLNFTVDIDGQTRSGTWDIGADEYVAAGGGANWLKQGYWWEMYRGGRG